MGANLEFANLRSANFRSGDLHRARLANADLEDADLVGANLAGSDLTGASLKNADLRNINISGINWRKILSIQGANIYGVRNPPDGFLSWALDHGAHRRLAGRNNRSAWCGGRPRPRRTPRSPGKGSAFGPFQQDSHPFGPSKNYSSPDAAGDRYNETSRWEGEPY